MKVKINKFNPFHDSNGRFSSSNGMKTFSANPYTKEGQMAMQRHKGTYGGTMNVHQNSKGHTNLENVSYLNGRHILIVGSKLQTMGGATRQARLAAANAGEPYQSKTSPKIVGGAPSQQAQAKPASKNQTQQQKPAAQQNQTQQAQSQQQVGGKKGVAQVRRHMKSGVISDAEYDQTNVKNAVNKEFRGTAEGKDLTGAGGFDSRMTTATDYYLGHPRYTNKIADLQGFNSPAARVDSKTFNQLEQAAKAGGYGDIMYRTVSSGVVDGRFIDAKKMKAQMTANDDFAMNGNGGRAHGDGIYTASTSMTAHNKGKSAYDGNDARSTKTHSQCYGDGKTTLKMTWLSKPKIINKATAEREFNKLSTVEKSRYGDPNDPHTLNAYVCAKGYDAMRTRSNNYLLIFNRSKLAVLDD